MIDKIREKLDPQQMAEEMRARKEQADAFVHRQAKEREDRIVQLKAAERTDLSDLTERHEQQQRDHSARYDKDRARYLREMDAAALRATGIEERRRQEERAERDRNRDGPPPDRAR